MESRESKWLKRKYQEVEYSSSGGPNVKFSRLSDDIKLNFPDKSYSSRTLSAIVREAFPHSESRQLTASRNKFVFGVEPKPDEGCSGAHDEMAELQEQVERLKSQLSDRDCEVERLQGQVVELDTNVKKLQGRVVELENQVEKLQRRVAELAHTHETQFSLATLQSQMLAVLRPEHQVYHGPNTIENFQTFSIETVVSELQCHAPDAFQLLKSLSDQKDEESVTLHNLRIVTALVAILKNRSVRLLGVQLLLTFTLIARATSKQVQKLMINTNIHTVTCKTNTHN